jgi:sulfate adenylyltransferase
VNIQLTERQRYDLEMLVSGGFAPLTGFLTERDYQSVLTQMRLANGALWPMPITLDLGDSLAARLSCGQSIFLCDAEGHQLARLVVSSIWQPDKTLEAQAVFGTTSPSHPGVHYLLTKTGRYYVGGEVLPVAEPRHADFQALRLTAQQLRDRFKALGWDRVVGFQTRNPMHRAHFELTCRAADQLAAKLLIHPVVGPTKPGDIDYRRRVRCYEKLMPYYRPNTAMLSLLPLAMRMAGPREALWHALIRKNFGCTHFIVGRDHAGPGVNEAGQPFYLPYAAQDLVAMHQNEAGIAMVPFQEMVYVRNKQCYLPANEVVEADDIARISGTEFRRRLQEGARIPEWFSFPEVLAALKHQKKSGCCIFFTGLSAAGKSTLAKALANHLEAAGKTVSLLDGDIVRQNLSKGLGFSREDRDENVRRVGYVATEIVKHGGVAICALIAPYKTVRDEVREKVEMLGDFIEVFVDTPLAVCELRDPKGLYQRARAGELKQFTGIDDVYEPPVNPEVRLDTSIMSVEECLSGLLDACLPVGGIVSRSRQADRLLPDPL